MGAGEQGFWKRAWSSYNKVHWVIFNFVARRVIATGFVMIGLLIGIVNAPVLLPGGTIPVDGVPNDDFVLRLASVFLPLLVAALGVALFRTEPFNPD